MKQSNKITMNAVYIKAKQTGIELTYLQPFWTACKGTNHDHLGNHHRLTHKFHPRNSVSTKTMYAISTIFYNKTATSSCPFDINICFASSTDHNVVQEEPVQGLFLCSFFMGAWGAKIIRFYRHQCYVREKSIFQKWTRTRKFPHFNNFGQSCDPWLKGTSATLPKAKQIQWLHIITWMDNRTNHAPTNGPWKANTSPLPHHQAGKIWLYRCMWKEEHLEPISGKSHVLYQQAKDPLSSSFIL